MAATVIYLPWCFAPQMPKVSMSKLTTIEAPTTDSIARARADQLRERLENHICIECGTPLLEREAQPCPSCVVASFTKLAGIQ